MVIGIAALVISPDGGGGGLGDHIGQGDVLFGERLLALAIEHAHSDQFAGGGYQRHDKDRHAAQPPVDGWVEQADLVPRVDDHATGRREDLVHDGPDELLAEAEFVGLGHAEPADNVQ